MPPPGSVGYERVSNVTLGDMTYPVGYRYGSVIAVTRTVGAYRYGEIWTSDGRWKIMSFNNPVSSVSAVKEAAKRLASATNWNSVARMVRPGPIEAQTRRYRAISPRLADLVGRTRRFVYG